MTSNPGAPVVRVKPQSNIYTLLIIVAAVVLATGAGYLMHHMMTDYGLTFGEIFTGKQLPAM